MNPRILVLNAIAIACGNIVLKPSENVQVFLWDEGHGLYLASMKDGDYRHVGVLANNKSNDYKLTTNNKTLAIFDYGNGVELKVNVIVSSTHWKVRVSWTGPRMARHEDCLDLGIYHWYGGPEQKKQYWPVEKLTLSEYAYVSKEAENSAITESYWVNSQGTLVYVYPEAALFIDQNNVRKKHLCLVADVKHPYSKNRQNNNLNYDVVFTQNARIGHEYAVRRYLGKPDASPDFRMIQHPIWSTWARYSRPINQSILLDFANQIVSNGFNNSQFEIDDLWETCYGSFVVREDRFPNFKEMVSAIKSMGFRVTMWIHPFINNNCEIFKEAESKGYLVRTESGEVLTQWWNSNGKMAGYIDFTNPDATSWWIKRVIHLQNQYDIDSFKFDAGESSWSPQIPVQHGSFDMHPFHITVDYVRAVSDFGSMIEVRAGKRTQDLPVFVRMVDKDTLWTFENGLPTLVTTLLQMNMNGYTLVLPDMIGGNGYNEKPSKELFIRWLQANVFMPSLQYSFVPWDYDAETIEISQYYSTLHSNYAEEIAKVMAKCVADGSPVNPPIWWLDPEDSEALGVWDEFLLGENILIAPVLTKGADARDIYLPGGLWRYQGEGDTIAGKQWLREFPAPIDTLPYFVRIEDNQ